MEVPPRPEHIKKAPHDIQKLWEVFIVEKQLTGSLPSRVMDWKKREELFESSVKNQRYDALRLQLANDLFGNFARVLPADDANWIERYRGKDPVQVNNERSTELVELYLQLYEDELPRDAFSKQLEQIELVKDLHKKKEFSKASVEMGRAFRSVVGGYISRKSFAMVLERAELLRSRIQFVEPAKKVKHTKKIEGFEERIKAICGEDGFGDDRQTPVYDFESIVKLFNDISEYTKKMKNDFAETGDLGHLALVDSEEGMGNLSLSEDSGNLSLHKSK